MKAKVLLIAVAVAVAMLPGCAAIQSKAQPSPVDQQFMFTPASVGIAEIETARLAMQRLQDAVVQRHGWHKVENHTRVNTGLQRIADGKQVVLPKAMDPANHSLHPELSRLSDPAFDHEYMRTRPNICNMGIGPNDSEPGHGKDALLRGVAARNKPVGMKPLKRVQELAR
jgi:putative membrane protein